MKVNIIATGILATVLISTAIASDSEFDSLATPHLRPMEQSAQVTNQTPSSRRMSLPQELNELSLIELTQ